MAADSKSQNTLLRIRRAALEADLLAVVKNFEAETGLRVMRIDVDRVDVTTVNDATFVDRVNVIEAVVEL